MPKDDIERQIDNFWGNVSRLLNDEDEDEFNKIFAEIQERFIDPTSDNPVKAVDFTRWLNPEPLVEVLKTSYPYFNYIKNRFEPRIRFFAYFMISRKKNLWQAYQSLTEEEYIMLGFKGKPTYELLREFVYERIEISRFPEFFKQVVKELVFLLRRKNIHIGEHVFQDATDIRALKHDPDAKYSGYYKHSGYKLDVTLDAEYDIPLCYVPMELTDDEGKNLLPSLEYTSSLGLCEEERVVDCSYASFPNIAFCELNKVSLVYKIADNWVRKEEADPEEIKRLYQKYHSCSDFVVNPSLDFMLRYLYKKEEYETVGGYYRNQRMDEKDSEDYMGKCKKRSSRMEGFFGRVKTTTLLDDRPCKRGWKGFLFRIGTAMLSLVVAALIRVQNGVLKHLTNVTYIT